MTRWIAILILALALSLALLACGGDSNGANGQPTGEERPANTPTVSAPDGDTSTPEARTQRGAKLTTQEYAEALECDGQEVNIATATYEEMLEAMNPYIAELEGFSPPPEVARWHELYIQSLRTFLDGLSHLEADDTIDGDSLSNLYVLLADTMEEVVAEEEAWPNEVHQIMYDAGCAETEPAEPIEQRSEPSAPVEAPSAPGAQTQRGAEPTTQEYVEALEEIISDFDDKIDDAGEDLWKSTFSSREELERLGSLETAEFWSEEDAEVARELAETLVRAMTDFSGYSLEIAGDTLDEMSGLKPPEHLSDLHEDFIRAYGEIVRFTPEWGRLLDEIDTDIRNQEDFADFYALIISGSGSLDPDLEAKAEELEEQTEEACQKLQDQLEAELGRDVDICE